MSDKTQNKRGDRKPQDKDHAQSQKTELRDNRGSRRPIVEQKVTSNLKPPTRPKDK